MRHLIKKVAVSKSEIIAHKQMGDDAFRVMTREGSVYGSFNNCDVFRCVQKTDTHNRVSHLVEDFIKYCVNKNKNSSFTVFREKSAADFVPLFDSLAQIPGTKKVVFKDIADSKAPSKNEPSFNVCDVLDYGRLVNALKEFVPLLTEITNVLNVCREDAMTLTGGKLVNTMWGAKPMQHMLDDMNRDVEENSSWERIEFFSTLIAKSVERLIHKLLAKNSSVNLEDKKMLSTVIIPNILLNYDQFKAVAQSALMTLSSIIYIDILFKKMTHYPANWFLSGGMLDDLKQDYDKLLGFFVEAPNIERNIVYPLDFLKIRYSTEI